MDLETVHAHRVVGQLREEAEADVLAELAGLVAYARAQPLKAEAAEYIKRLKREAKSHEKAQAELSEAVNEASDALVQLRADCEVARQKRIRVKAGLESGKAPDVPAVEVKAHEAQRALGNLRGELRTVSNRANMARRNLTHWEAVLRSLGAMERPPTSALGTVWQAMGSGAVEE